MTEDLKRKPGELYVTRTGRTVEILAVDDVTEYSYGSLDAKIETVAYKFVGGSMIHLRSARQTQGWQRVQEDN